MSNDLQLNVTPGGSGAEGLDALCQQIRVAVNAKYAVVVVLDGDHGSGYSVVGPVEAQALLPSILEQMAATLRSQLKEALK